MRQSSSIALSVLLLAVCFGLSGCAQSDTTSLVGSAAPDFSLKSVDGRELKLSDQRGRVVILDFWATWCQPCQMSLPHLQTLSQDQSLAARNVVVWAVNEQESADTVRSFLQANHFTFTVALDSTGSVGSDYKVTGIPATVVIGPDGVIKNAFVGFGDESAKQIDDAIHQALGG